MAFQQGLSGLSAASKALDVIGNNVSNSATVGFKSARANFADVYASSLSGGGASQVGIGTAVSAIQQQITQGNITTTNNSLDIAINGGGFFRMDTNGSITYTRNGQFHLDKNGYVVNDQSAKLTGYPVDANGLVVKSSPVDLQISSAAIAPVATGASVGGTFQGVLANVNLDSRDTAKTWSSTTSNGVMTANSAGYNYTAPVTVYDTLGNSHTLTLYFSKSTTTGAWDVHANVDGTDEANVTLSGSPLTFNTSGVLTSTTPLGVSIDLDGVAADLTLSSGSTVTNDAASTLAFNIDFTGSNQFGSTSATNSLEQDGYTSGSLTGLSVGDDGVVQGNYSNGQSRQLGQVVLANFANPNGLASLGNNQWSETTESGAALVGSPNSGRLGVLQSQAIEESNVDLTAELVSMITAQRNYQASAQTIKTQDAVMQTLVNLR